MHLKDCWLDNKDNVTKALRMLNDGASFRVVAEAFSTTRNAVSGFVWRQRKKGVRIHTLLPNGAGTTHRRSPVVVKLKREKKDKKAPVTQSLIFGAPRPPSHFLRAPQAPEAALARAAKNEPVVSLIPRTVLDAKMFQCRFPISGIGADMMFCGNKVAHVHTSYCEGHGKTVYQPEIKRKHRRKA